MSIQEANSAATLSERQLSDEAAEWFLRMSCEQADPDDIYINTPDRNAAFRKWYTRSPRHLQAFLEICEMNHQLTAELLQGVDVESLMTSRKAEVIALYTSDPTKRITPPLPARSGKRPQMLAAAAIVLLGILTAILPFAARDLATGIGEQRTFKLDDGSIVQLNTNTRIAVDYSNSQRNIHIVQGEALFSVEHDPQRPFIVTAGSAHVRAVGTQFNVRARAGSVDVAVIEGIVQVTSGDAVSNDPSQELAPATGAPVSVESQGYQTRLLAGQAARVSHGSVVSLPSTVTADSLSWRERRLVFHEATLGEVAAEFNRYNRTQIKVSPALASVPMFKAAIFDADRPQALILYVSKDDSLTVEPDGTDWIIRPRAPDAGQH